MLSLPTTTVSTTAPRHGTEEMIAVSLDASPENEMQSFPMSRSSSSSTVDDPKDLPETPIRALVTLPVESPSTLKAGNNVSIPGSTSDVCPLAPFPRRVRFVEEPFVRIIPGRQTLLTSEYVALEVDGQRTGLWKSVMGIFQDPLGVDSVSLRSSEEYTGEDQDALVYGAPQTSYLVHTLDAFRFVSWIIFCAAFGYFLVDSIIVVGGYWDTIHHFDVLATIGAFLKVAFGIVVLLTTSVESIPLYL